MIYDTWAELGMVIHIIIPDTWEVETEASWEDREFKVSLGKS
jgi:hypothetical protein